MIILLLLQRGAHCIQLPQPQPLLSDTMCRSSCLSAAVVKVVCSVTLLVAAAWQQPAAAATLQQPASELPSHGGGCAGITAAAGGGGPEPLTQKPNQSCSCCLLFQNSSGTFPTRCSDRSQWHPSPHLVKLVLPQVSLLLPPLLPLLLLWGCQDLLNLPAPLQQQQQQASATSCLWQLSSQQQQQGRLATSYCCCCCCMAAVHHR